MSSFCNHCGQLIDSTPYKSPSNNQKYCNIYCFEDQKSKEEKKLTSTNLERCKCGLQAIPRSKLDDDFDDEEFYGLCLICFKKKVKMKGKKVPDWAFDYNFK